MARAARSAMFGGIAPALRGGAMMHTACALLATFLLAATACKDGAPRADSCRDAPGTLGCDCKEGATCVGDLECLSGKCVGGDLPGRGADSGPDRTVRPDGGRPPPDAGTDAGCPDCDEAGVGCQAIEDCEAETVCVDGRCVQPYCGDGYVMGGEQCDNGPANSPDAYGPDECTDFCERAPYCGDAALQQDKDEQCDQGAANAADVYGEGTCTTRCRHGGTCGDGARNGGEQCDGGSTPSTDLGACNPECTGFYERKAIRLSAQTYSTDLGGPSGADAKCVEEFGADYKALLVGGARRATLTPLLGDGQQDWVIAKYSYYYNADDQLVWRTDALALLGVRDGARQDLLAPAWVPSFAYPWSGYATDWTTIPDAEYSGTCSGWTVAAGPGYGGFAFDDLRAAAGEPCGSSSYIVCVEQ